MKLKDLVLEAQTVPKVGDWYEDSDFNYHEIRQVNRQKKNFTIRKDNTNFAIDFWNVESGGSKSGKKVWKTTAR